MCFVISELLHWSCFFSISLLSGDDQPVCESYCHSLGCYNHLALISATTWTLLFLVRSSELSYGLWCLIIWQKQLSTQHRHRIQATHQLQATIRRATNQLSCNGASSVIRFPQRHDSKIYHHIPVILLLTNSNTTFPPKISHFDITIGLTLRHAGRLE